MLAGLTYLWDQIMKLGGHQVHLSLTWALPTLQQLSYVKCRYAVFVDVDVKAPSTAYVVLAPEA